MSAPTFPDFPPVIRQVPYTLHLDYLAFGTGSLVQVMVTLAADPEEAISQFRQTFYPTYGADAWSYLRRGLDVYEGVHRPLLTRWFTEAMVRGMERNARHNLRIAFHWSFNAG